MADLPTTLSPEETLRRFTDLQLQGARVCVPARVERWRPDIQAVDCLPLVATRLEDGTVQTPVVVSKIPVAWPRWGGYVFRIPPSEGDLVTLLVSDRDLDEWLSGQGQPVEPQDPRAHDLDDAVALPGITTWGNPAPGAGDGDLFLGREDQSTGVRITPGGELRLDAGGAADTPLVRGNELQAFLQQVLVWLATHTHTSTPPGQSTSPSVQAGALPQIPATLLSQFARMR